jgi:DNA-binding beta-propeller fold protein YncE
MRCLRVSVAAMIVAFVSLPALAQNRLLSPEMQADTEALRALTKTIPLLPVDRIAVQVKPAMTLVRYSAVAGDKDGNLYVIHRPDDKSVDPVVVLDPKGTMLHSWGKGLYAIPHGIRIDPAGHVWTIDAHTSLVTKYTKEGHKLLEISVGDIPDPNRPFCGATDVTFGTSGQIYVSDGYCNGRVIEYTAEGQKVRAWGKRGTGQGEFVNAHAIAISPDGTLYVADRENGRLQWFDLEGQFLGEKHFGGLLYSVAISATGELYVGTQPRGVPFGQDASIMQFDPASGMISSQIKAAAHLMSVAPDGTILPGTLVDKTDSVLLLRPKK